MINKKSVFNNLFIVGIFLFLHIAFSIKANNVRSINSPLDNIEALASNEITLVVLEQLRTLNVQIKMDAPYAFRV